MPLPLHGSRLLLRPPRETDLDPLCAILAEPEVAERWPGYGRERVRAELIAPDPDEVTVLVIERAAVVIGAIQYGEERDPQYRHASLDILLSRSTWGQGLGPEAMRTLARHLFTERGHHRLTTDPAADNARALRAYEKVGFRREGVLRQDTYRDGRYWDTIVMGMLREEWKH